MAITSGIMHRSPLEFTDILVRQETVARSITITGTPLYLRHPARSSTRSRTSTSRYGNKIKQNGQKAVEKTDRSSGEKERASSYQLDYSHHSRRKMDTFRSGTLVTRRSIPQASQPVDITYIRHRGVQQLCQVTDSVCVSVRSSNMKNSILHMEQSGTRSPLSSEHRRNHPQLWGRKTYSKLKRLFRIRVDVGRRA